jgi:DNA-binding NarL/FixJ family response regulator
LTITLSFAKAWCASWNRDLILGFVGHCATIAQARQILSSTPLGVILLDYDLREEFGTDLLQEFHIRESSVRVLIVTAGMRDNVTLNALNTGVAGVIFKHSGPGQLIDAIKRVARGETWLDEGIVRSLIADSSERKNWRREFDL